MLILFHITLEKATEQKKRLRFMIFALLPWDLSATWHLFKLDTSELFLAPCLRGPLSNIFGARPKAEWSCEYVDQKLVQFCQKPLKYETYKSDQFFSFFFLLKAHKRLKMKVACMSPATLNEYRLLWQHHQQFHYLPQWIFFHNFCFTSIHQTFIK